MCSSDLFRVNDSMNMRPDFTSSAKREVRIIVSVAQSGSYRFEKNKNSSSSHLDTMVTADTFHTMRRENV